MVPDGAVVLFQPRLMVSRSLPVPVLEANDQPMPRQNACISLPVGARRTFPFLLRPNWWVASRCVVRNP
jgi:hypothetical protein